MSQPSVCCVMLTKDRPEMAARAVRCFREQTYGPKRLLIFDTGFPVHETYQDSDSSVCHVLSGVRAKWTIGALRNEACRAALVWGCDIFAHFDDDDYSHPNRLTEQVALLQASGADAVGYNSALFWDTRGRMADFGDAWLYTSPKSDIALGGTLLYWRRTWERKRFQDLRFGEDTAWQTGLKVAAVSAMGSEESRQSATASSPEFEGFYTDPRFIAHVHGGNTSSVITPTVRDWRRCPEADEHCRRIMRAQRQ